MYSIIIVLVWMVTIITTGTTLSLMTVLIRCTKARLNDLHIAEKITEVYIDLEKLAMEGS